MGTYVGIARKNVQLSQARFHKRDVKKVFPDRAFCDGVTMGYVPHCDEERQIVFDAVAWTLSAVNVKIRKVDMGSKYVLMFLETLKHLIGWVISHETGLKAPKCQCPGYQS